MKMYLISDNIDTLVGMRTAGVNGCVAHGKEEVCAAIKQAIGEKDLGILILTEKAGECAREYLSELKLTLHTPLIVEIPDRHGSRDIADSINSLVRESIGLKL